jgi:hypothetical protein
LYAVSALLQFLEKPSLTHSNAAEQVFCYVAGTRDVGLTYKKQNEQRVKAYANADWGDCIVTRQSVTGYVVITGDHVLLWKSNKQDTISLSSAEAECKALSDLSREIVWISSLINEINIFKSPSNILVYIDNKAAIDLAQNGFCTKHMDIRLHFLCKHVQSHLHQVK